MFDTIRTRAALATLFEDNTTGEIGPQDIRDFLLSTYNWVNATVDGNISYSSGNVGIGTTSPSGKLVVAGSADVPQLIVQGNSTQTSDLADFTDSNGSNLLRIYYSSGYVTLNTGAVVTHPAIYMPTGVRVANAGVIGNAGAGGSFTFNGDASISVKNSSDVNYARFYSSSGGLSLGTGYVGTAAPTNGLIVQGNVGIGTTTPSALLDVNSDILRLRTAKTPATAGAAGNAGNICWDANYIYVCISTNTWRRTQHATW